VILQVQSMLQLNISERLGCLKGGLKDLKRHKWFAEIDWDKLAKKELKVSRRLHTFLATANALAQSLTSPAFYRGLCCRHHGNRC
jgi:hypothetical protein